jgi:hypothetical protein
LKGLDSTYKKAAQAVAASNQNGTAKKAPALKKVDKRKSSKEAATPFSDSAFLINLSPVLRRAQTTFMRFDNNKSSSSV